VQSIRFHVPVVIEPASCAMCARCTPWKPANRKSSTHAAAGRWQTMRGQTFSFRNTVDQIVHADAIRCELVLNAFRDFEHQFGTLAQMLLYRIGDRQRAARWMCVRRHAFDGRSACELLADGDVNPIWDYISGSGEDEEASPRLQTQVY
jgi:hypothetical protein